MLFSYFDWCGLKVFHDPSVFGELRLLGPRGQVLRTSLSWFSESRKFGTECDTDQAKDLHSSRFEIEIGNSV